MAVSVVGFQLQSESFKPDYHSVSVPYFGWCLLFCPSASQAVGRRCNENRRPLGNSNKACRFLSACKEGTRTTQFLENSCFLLLSLSKTILDFLGLATARIRNVYLDRTSSGLVFWLARPQKEGKVNRAAQCQTVNFFFENNVKLFNRFDPSQGKGGNRFPKRRLVGLSLVVYHSRKGAVAFLNGH